MSLFDILCQWNVMVMLFSVQDKLNETIVVKDHGLGLEDSIQFYEQGFYLAIQISEKSKDR